MLSRLTCAQGVKSPMPTAQLTPPKGSFIFYDFRTMHRGIANDWTGPRPISLLSYVRTWWRDGVNFKTQQTKDWDDLPSVRPTNLLLLFEMIMGAPRRRNPDVILRSVCGLTGFRESLAGSYEEGAHTNRRPEVRDESRGGGGGDERRGVPGQPALAW